MPVKLLRCSARWAKWRSHACWRVEKALIDMGLEYEVVPGPALPWRRKERRELIEKTGDDRYPAIEFENGSVYREESKGMERTIRAGRLSERSGQQAAAGSVAG